MAQVLPTTTSPTAPAARGPLGRDGLAVALILACYLLAALAVTWHLWADPASRTIAGNPNDADLFAWFLRYDATAVAHGRLPALVTSAMNAPQGINVMWNTSMLLPGVLLTPVTLLLGAQTSLTVLTTAGFAGSAASMFLVLRRWEVSTSAAALAGAVYGFSPALLHASVGHYSTQLAILPPLIIDAGLRLCLRSVAPVRDGIVLGLLVTAQIFTGEELLLLTALAGLLLLTVLALGRPRATASRWRPAAAGLGVAAVVTLLLAGYPLWVQFFGPLTQHGSAFTPDFFENDLTSFLTPSRYLLFHTAASAAAAAGYRGGVPEYLAFLGWPLIAVLAATTLAFWRRPAVRAAAVTLLVLEILSLGGHPLVNGNVHAGVTLPWRWLEALPVLGAALPDRLSIAADGAAAALLAFGIDLARAKLAPVSETVQGDGEAGGPPQAGQQHSVAGSGEGRPDAGARRRAIALLGRTLVVAGAVAACLPLVPLALPAAPAPALPAGWTAAFAALRLPPGARVLVVPVPTATLTQALRWQADTGEPASLIGGYFNGPGPGGQAYVDGNGPAATAVYLDGLWSGGSAAAAPAGSQVRADLNAWRPAAVVAVTSPGSPLGRYLVQLFGRPGIQAGRVLAWRL
ncbi:MAG TPA: hypothetical protein VGR98_02195 [Streptosporangiaceae bacterium]|nr:hypothetical protein [Streptosporangiaceae bacterium]